MNTMLASDGYPRTVIPVEERVVYMAALEEASVGQNIEPFTDFLAQLVQAGRKGRPLPNFLLQTNKPVKLVNLEIMVA